MRVIAGKLKGRHLKAVPGTATRPTSDKIKEAVFHKMGPFFEGGHCLDLFAGSGSLGIEAISRGVDRVIFVEKSSLAIRTIHKNVTKLQIESQCEIYRNNAFRAIQILSKKNIHFDLIIIDPPYEKVDYTMLINDIDESNILQHSGLLYFEHSPKEEIIFQPTHFDLLYEKKYNATTGVTILLKKK